MKKPRLSARRLSWVASTLLLLGIVTFAFSQLESPPPTPSLDGKSQVTAITQSLETLDARTSDLAKAQARLRLRSETDRIARNLEQARNGIPASSGQATEDLSIEVSKLVEELSKNNGGGDFKWAVSLEERNKLWQARHDVYWSVKALGNNMKVYSTDVCVPISNLVECISWAEKEVKKHDLIAPMVGHVGDGNFHSIILFDPNDKEKQKKIRQYSDDLISKALELEGTITGEHGIGLQKKHYLLKEHPDNIPVMKSIKCSLDINNIMNPGKVFDLN